MYYAFCLCKSSGTTVVAGDCPYTVVATYYVEDRSRQGWAFRMPGSAACCWLAADFCSSSRCALPDREFSVPCVVCRVGSWAGRPCHVSSTCSHTGETGQTLAGEGLPRRPATLPKKYKKIRISTMVLDRLKGSTIPSSVKCIIPC